MRCASNLIDLSNEKKGEISWKQKGAKHVILSMSSKVVQWNNHLTWLENFSDHNLYSSKNAGFILLLFLLSKNTSFPPWPIYSWGIWKILFTCLFLRRAQSSYTCTWSRSLHTTWDHNRWCNWWGIWQDSKMAWSWLEEEWWSSYRRACQRGWCKSSQIFSKLFPKVSLFSL